ncbi:MAG: hypothetical protein BV456_04650 [Thermoplasmata archaeon M8B2D]|nr:MAG: hypothetical protein BV456_04650 [Thermoplasmata archaeon M8B2D]
MSKHEHAYCEHKHLKYCKHCNLVFCEDCGYEWKNQLSYWTYTPHDYTTSITWNSDTDSLLSGCTHDV